jgi:hypothetical protein
MQRRQATSHKPRQLSPGALLGLGLAIIAVIWLVYAFLGELAYPPATQRAGDLEVFLYPTLTGRRRVGDNQFEVKLGERQGQPVSQAAVEVAYGMGRVGDENRRRRGVLEGALRRGSGQGESSCRVGRSSVSRHEWSGSDGDGEHGCFGAWVFWRSSRSISSPTVP